jgi:hypothetical protein
VAPSLGVELRPLGVRDAGEIECGHWRGIADQQIRGSWSPVSMSTICLPPKMVRDSARLRRFISWLHGFKNPRVAREVSENVIIDSIARFEARPGPHYTGVSGKIFPADIRSLVLTACMQFCVRIVPFFDV